MITLREIRRMQAKAGLTQTQKLIESGDIWKFEGSMGREAMHLLRTGACFLPKVSHRDYYGNRVPARQDLKKGTIGTIELSSYYWFTNSLIHQ